MSLITRNRAKEYRSIWLYNKCHKIYLSGPFGSFCLYVILTISDLPARTIETSSLPTDSSRPLFKQIEIFFLPYWLYITTVSTFLNIRASLILECLLGIEPAGAIIPPPPREFRTCLQVCKSASLQVCGLQVCSLRLSHTVAGVLKMLLVSNAF